MSAKFCGECGTALTAPVKFCPNCGQPTTAGPTGSSAATHPAAPPTDHAAAAPPTAYAAAPTPAAHTGAVHVTEQHDLGPGQWSPAYSQRPPRPRGPLLVAGGVALVLVVGAVGAYAVFGDGLLGGGGGLPGAVTSEPSRSWRYDADDTILSAVSLGDDIVVATDGDDVIAVDQDGDERWSRPAGSFVVQVPDDTDHVVVSDYDDSAESSTTTVLDGEDGDELWSMEGYPIGFLEGSLVVVAADDGMSVADLGDGEVKWESDAQAFTVVPDAVYTMDGDTLEKRAPSDGEVRWSADVSDAGDIDEDTGSVRANDKMAVVAASDAVAFSADDGEQLWTADGGPDGADVNPYSDSEMTVGRVDFSEDPDPAITVYDEKGEVAELDLPDDSGGYLYTTVVESGGESYALDVLSGWLYDEDHEVAERFDGQVTALADGFYELSGLEYDDETGEQDPELVYTTIDDGTQWRFSPGSADNLAVTALDEKLLITAGDTISLYE